MTDQSEVEKLENIILPLVAGHCQSAERVARWHIRDKEIAVLEAKIQAIDDVKGKTNYSAKDNYEYVVRWSEFDKEIKKLQSRLAELRKEKV